MVRRNACQPKLHRRTGTVAVEFALVAPVIFLLFLSAIEIANLNFVRHTAGNAAYEGARNAIIAGGTADDASQEALRLLNLMGVGNGATVDVTLTTTSVSVSVMIPMNQNSWGISRFTNGTIVTQSCTLNREIVDKSL